MTLTFVQVVAAIPNSTGNAGAVDVFASDLEAAAASSDCFSKYEW